MRKLLILDLDETLVYADEQALARTEDMRVGPYFVYFRPHLADFIAFALETFDVGVWTASGESYASQVIERVFPAGSLKLLWSSQRCTTARDWTTGGYQTIKKLDKLKRHGFPLESIIAVDDTPSNYARSYGNLVRVTEYTGASEDRELLLLRDYLRRLVHVPNVRAVEKRYWRQEALADVGTSDA